MIGKDLTVTFADGSKRTVHLSPATVAGVARVRQAQGIAGAEMPESGDNTERIINWAMVAAFVECVETDGLTDYPDYYRWVRHVRDIDFAGDTNPTRAVP